ncbi:oxalate oxidoreductase subunit delta [Thermovenabulum gondwanense]|uniref:Oxalate oxidoreductase subunit delta n=1 Tax=Thermovenabulum gondwanense TaxID=520767 RepID=A0A162MWI5_9FIRM|nr:2-oxoacid:acceptor oxidoreductase family protein [Thermovenabulum gondwanense]KYO68021.1 Oxalate oxidoreductase subunit delta [Thermovenabulum gondwanense]
MSSADLFKEPNLKQITVWSRGVIMNKDARDVVVALTEAAAKEGKYVQAWENYVDLPDRINVPVRAYARISSDPIASRYVYENESPDIVVVLEETLVKGVPVLKGIKPGSTLIVNTRRSIDTILKFLGDTGNLAQIATVDASSMAEAVITLSGAEGATDATGIGAGIAAPIVGAVAKVTGIVDVENLAKVVKNPAAMRRGYEEVQVKTLPPKPAVEETKLEAMELLKQMPFAGTVPSPQEENEGMITGNWRMKRPVLNTDACTQCWTCWIYCPDSCIKKGDDGPLFNLKYCKGCGLCAAVCPTGAITQVPELDFED